MFSTISSAAKKIAPYLWEDLAQEGIIKFLEVKQIKDERYALVAAVNVMKRYKRRWELSFKPKKILSKLFDEKHQKIKFIDNIHYKNILKTILKNLTEEEQRFVKDGFDKKELNATYSMISRKRKKILKKIELMGLDESEIFL